MYQYIYIKFYLIYTIICYFVNQCVFGRGQDTYICDEIGLPKFGPQSNIFFNK